MQTTYTFKGTTACLPCLIRLRNGHAANGLPVPTLTEIGASRGTAPCQYCAIRRLAEIDEEEGA